jgi:hypothetical protein
MNSSNSSLVKKGNTNPERNTLAPSTVYLEQGDNPLNLEKSGKMVWKESFPEELKLEAHMSTPLFPNAKQRLDIRTHKSSRNTNLNRSVHLLGSFLESKSKLKFRVTTNKDFLKEIGENSAVRSQECGEEAHKEEDGFAPNPLHLEIADKQNMDADGKTEEQLAHIKTKTSNLNMNMNMNMNLKVNANENRTQKRKKISSKAVVGEIDLTAIKMMEKENPPANARSTAGVVIDFKRQRQTIRVSHSLS